MQILGDRHHRAPMGMYDAATLRPQNAAPASQLKLARFSPEQLHDFQLSPHQQEHHALMQRANVLADYADVGTMLATDLDAPSHLFWVVKHDEWVPAPQCSVLPDWVGMGDFDSTVTQTCPCCLSLLPPTPIGAWHPMIEGAAYERRLVSLSRYLEHNPARLISFLPVNRDVHDGRMCDGGTRFTGRKPVAVVPSPTASSPEPARPPSRMTQHVIPTSIYNTMIE